MRPGEAWHAAIFRFVRNFTPENSCVDLVLRDLAWFQLISWLPVTLFSCSRGFTIWPKQPAAETAARSRCSIRYWTVSLQSMYSLYLHQRAPKSDQKNFTFPNPQPYLSGFQGRSICGSAAERKLHVVLFLQGHRWGFVWLLLAGIDLQRWLIISVWFDVAEHPLLSQGWWSSLLLSQLSLVMDELSTSYLQCRLRTYLILHPEILQPLVGILITLHGVWLG